MSGDALGSVGRRLTLVVGMCLGYFSMGRSILTTSYRPPRSSGAGSRYTSFSVMSSSRTSRPSVRSSMSSVISSRIGGPNRRCSSSRSRVWMRFSDSSSSTSTSSFLVIAELVVFEHVHAGEQLVQMVRDEVFERDEPQQPAVVIRQLDEPRQHRRHLEPGELLLARLGAAHPHREVERQAGDVGERMRGVDRERHQHREDLGGEDLVERQPVGRGEVHPARRCGCRPRRGPASPDSGTPRHAAPAARAPSR